MNSGARCLCCGLPLEEASSGYHLRCCKALFSSLRVPDFSLTSEALNAMAKETLLQRISVPGVQPKLSLHLEHGRVKAPSLVTLVGLEGDYILKLQTPQWKALPEAEHFCMMLAQTCRIPTADFGLIPIGTELAYLSRRMDRTASGPLHMEDFCQLLSKMTAQKYNGSMEQIGKALRQYSSTPGLDIGQLFDRTLFCFLTGNSDMHLKNFSLLRMHSGVFQLSPAYDLVPVQIILPEDREELALTMCGKKSHLKREDFLRFGKTLHLSDTQVKNSFERMVNSFETNVEKCLQRSFLPESMQHDFRRLATSRIQRLKKDVPS